MPNPEIPNVLVETSINRHERPMTLNSAPYLRIRSPLPTAVDFTVSAAPQNTFTLQLPTYATGLRLFTTTLLLLGLKYRPSSSLALLPHRPKHDYTLSSP